MRISHFSTFAVATALFPLVAGADNLLKNASFEQPKVEKRTDTKKGGDPARTTAETTWGHYMSMDLGGKIAVGLTNEISRTGTQSLYVEFNKASAGKAAFLMSDLIPVKPEEKYRVSLWGRMDSKRPLTLDRGRPILLLQVEFYQADQATQTGETEYRAQMIPGSAKHILFVSNQWNEYFAELKSPEDAEFMKITFNWDPPSADDGIADGVIYFDDAIVEGEPGRLVPSADPEPVPAPAGAPSAAPAPALPIPAPAAK